jgi:hypothetical protein
MKKQNSELYYYLNEFVLNHSPYLHGSLIIGEHLSGDESHTAKESIVWNDVWLSERRNDGFLVEAEFVG